MRASRRGGVYTLTARERQVLDLYRAGKTAGEIAAALGVQVGTARARLAVATDKERLAAAASEATTTDKRRSR